MTRPRMRSGLLCIQGRCLFYKPVGEVGRSCLCVGWLLLPRLCCQKSFLTLTGILADQADFKFGEANVLFSVGQTAAGFFCLTHGSRRISVATSHGDAFSADRTPTMTASFRWNLHWGRSTPNKLLEIRSGTGFSGNRTVARRLTVSSGESQSCTASRSG